jgi:hypothetical protein
MKKLPILLLAFACAGSLSAQTVQNTPSAVFDGLNHFMVTGNAEVTFIHDKDNSKFTDVNFKPIFLFHVSDKLFVEAEIEIETGDGQVNVGLEYANMCYMVNPYLILHAGRFLPKFGAYRGRMAEGFLNRFPTNPVGFGDGGIGASVETGVGALGGIPIGNARLSYDFYISNGPQLLTDTLNAGQFEYEAYTGNNRRSAIGGRIAILPFSNQSLEVGYSFLNKGNTSDGGQVPYSSVFMQAVDLNYYHMISPLRSMFRLMAEWRYQKVGNVTYYKGVDVDGNPAYPYTLSSNTPSCYYVTATLRPSQLGNKFLRNLEIAARYSHYSRPEDAAWSGGLAKTQRTTIALDYWLHWNSLLKFAYQFEKDTPDAFYAQVVFGF